MEGMKKNYMKLAELEGELKKVELGTFQTLMMKGDMILQDVKDVMVLYWDIWKLDIAVKKELDMEVML